MGDFLFSTISPKCILFTVYMSNKLLGQIYMLTFVLNKLDWIWWLLIIGQSQYVQMFTTNYLQPSTTRTPNWEAWRMLQWARSGGGRLTGSPRTSQWCRPSLMLSVRYMPHVLVLSQVKLRQKKKHSPIPPPVYLFLWVFLENIMSTGLFFNIDFFFLG